MAAECRKHHGNHECNGPVRRGCAASKIVKKGNDNGYDSDQRSGPADGGARLHGLRGEDETCKRKGGNQDAPAVPLESTCRRRAGKPNDCRDQRGTRQTQEFGLEHTRIHAVRQRCHPKENTDKSHQADGSECDVNGYALKHGGLPRLKKMLEKTHLAGFVNSLTSGVDLKLSIDLLDMSRHGMGRNCQNSTDLIKTHALSKQL